MTSFTGRLLSLAVFVVAACGGGDDDDQSRRDALPAGEEPTTTTTLATTTTAPPAPGLGAVQEVSGGTAAALDYVQPVAVDSPQPADAGYPADYVWSGLEVEVCVPNGTELYTVSNVSWSLTFEDHSVVQPSHTGYSGFPQPEYPFSNLPVSAGQCVRGWIVFPTPSATPAVGVSYTPGGVPGVAPPLVWSLTG